VHFTVKIFHGGDVLQVVRGNCSGDDTGRLDAQVASFANILCLLLDLVYFIFIVKSLR
jgi:hypothetical protein